MTERSDKKKNVDKVAASLAKNPLQSQREVAADTGLGLGTVNRNKDEAVQSGTNDNRIHTLTDMDFDCIKLGVTEIKRRLNSETELKEMKIGEISNVIKENTARYTLFRGSVTDDEGGLKEVTLTTETVQAMSHEEINERRKKLLGTD